MTSETEVDKELLVSEEELASEASPDTVVQPENIEQVVEIPEKFQGKSQEDIIKSYSELEKQLGKQAQELGDTRRLANDLLQKEIASLNTKNSESEAEADDEFDFENPLESVKKLIKKELTPVKEQLSAKDQEAVRQQLAEKHPDFSEVAASDDFAQWVNSSTLRQELYQRANENLEFDAAIELLDNYKAMNKPPSKEEVAAKQKAVQNNINEMSTESGTTGQTSSKVFKRRELINLRATNPNKYFDMADEIRLAYAEGRVR